MGTLSRFEVGNVIMGRSGASLSVVLPVRNGTPYIGEAVRSILTQTYRDFELVIVDDGSTDGTLDIITAFQKDDPRVRLERNPGSGLVDGLNHGIAVSTAPLIARMDADDVALPSRLRRQVDFLNEHPEIAVVGSHVTYIDEFGKPAGDAGVLPQTPEDIARHLLKGCCLRHPTVVMRREAVEKAGGYRRELLDAEDYDLWLRMAEQAALTNLPDVLLLYRVHSGQVSERKKWMQRLSRNLALLAAMERRQGSGDPIGTYACFTKGAARQKCLNRGCAKCVCDSVRIFERAEDVITGDSDAALTAGDIRDMVRYMAGMTMGDGQHTRLRILVQLSRRAVQLRAPFAFASALGTAFRIHPGRTLRLLAEPASTRRAR